MQNNTIPETVLLKIKKIQALAEQGIDGEKLTAQKLLTELCARYGVAIEELTAERKNTYTFKTRSSVYKLWKQCFVAMFDGTERYINNVKIYDAVPSGQLIYVELTAAEYIDFSQFYEWHRQNYLKERAKMRKIFESGYIQKHHLYAKHIDEKYVKTKEMTEEEYAAIDAMADLCNDETYHKQICNDETAYTKEED